MKSIGIVGGGPCGTYLAYALSKAGHQVTLYEREEDIGGCWGVQREKRTGAFTEHAPRVVFDNYVNTKAFFEEIGIDFDDNFKKVYSVFSQSLKDAIHFTMWDLTALTIAYMYPSIAWNCHTVQSVMETYNLTPKAREHITQLCYSISVSPDKMSAMEFFETIDAVLLSNMYEPRIPTTNPDGIIPKIKDALNNVTIRTNHTFQKHDQDDNTTTFSTPQGHIKTKHDKLIVCIPPEQLANVYPSLHKKAQSMSYTGIGVQFHYNETVNPKDIPHSQSKTIGSLRIIMSYNESEHCISCVILNVNTPILNDSNKQQLIDMTWKQLKESLPELPKYARATVTPSVYKQNGKWKCHHGAYYRNKDNDTISIHDIPGIAYVGSHNPRKFPFTSYESAIETAKYFLNESGLASKRRILKPWKVKEIIFVAFGLMFFTQQFRKHKNR